MITWSILNDFCSWWPLWWILPFLLGIVLGKIYWGKHKDKVLELESVLRNERSHNYELEKKVKKCGVERKQHDTIIAELQREKQNIQKEVTDLKLANLALKESFDLDKEELSTASKVTDVNAIVPVSEIPTPTSDKVDRKGDYAFLKDTNLQIIEGIGPKMEALLKENSIPNWKTLADKSQGELRAILDNYGGRYSIVNPELWPKQARLANKGKWDKLIKLQSAEGSDSKLAKILTKLGIL